MATLAETIRETTRHHLQHNKGLLFGQCISAVGWVGGTVPEMQPTNDPALEGGIVELPTCDVAGPGFVVGAALAGRRPIFICRYQGFMAYNLATIANYAAKSKEMWKTPCPIFVRSIAMEGHIGPVATGAHHSMAMRMPGIKVVAPMTPQEWLTAWNNYVAGDDPVYCSEHRLSYQNTDEPQQPQVVPNSEFVLIGISAGRMNIIKAAETLSRTGLTVVHHVVNLKPYRPDGILLYNIRNMAPNGVAVVVDSDYPICGAAEHIAQQLARKTRRPVHAIGLDDRTAGFATRLDNITPSPDKIIAYCLSVR